VSAQKVSLYIHIPFCAAFCDYCDFYSVATDSVADTSAVMDAFVEAVIADVDYQVEFFNITEISTAYIGGGTPSVLGARRVRVLLDSLKKTRGFSPVEFTIEANPESADEEFLSVCREGGVNRLSLGVQSFHEPSRREVNRIGRADMLEERLALVSRFFSGSFSADLITGLPYQNKSIVLNDIKRLLAFKPAHVSLYSLTVEGGTALDKKIKTNSVKMPDSDEADALWLAGRSALENEGYENYEVSNFALPQKRCLHNINYWLMGNWLGAGPAASGTVVNEETGTAKRFTFAPDLYGYLKTPSIHAAACEELDSAALMRESILMGFRYRDGPDTEKFRRRFGLAVEDCIGQTLARWKGRDKTLFLNSFLCEAFSEMDAKKL
jgi:oxygen-independent coproporphyrinogen-3 oxidase